MTDDVSMYTSEPIPADVLLHKALMVQQKHDRHFVETVCDLPELYDTLFDFIAGCMEHASVRWPYNHIMSERISRAAQLVYEAYEERKNEDAGVRQFEQQLHDKFAA